MASFTLTLGVESHTFTDGVQANTGILRDSNADALARVFYGSSGLRTDGNLKLGVIGGSTGSAANVTIDESSFNGFLFTTNNTAASRTTTFEAAATVPGKLIAVKKCDSSTTLTAHLKFNGAETGDGANTYDLYDQNEAQTWMSDATGWQMVGWLRPYPLERIIADPGNAGAIPVTRSGHVALVTAGAETRTIAAPTIIGSELLLYFKTSGGNCVVTVATTVNETGNNTITFSATGQTCRLTAVEEGSNKRWRLATVDGAALSTV